MMKVQNGWEKKSLDDLEDENSQRGSPVSAPGRSLSDASQNPSRQRRPSGISDVSDQVTMSPDERSTSGTGSAAAAYMPSPNTAHGAMPSTALDFSVRRKRRSSASFAPPPMLSAAQRKHNSDLGASTRTSMGPPRPGILRMPSQQAEKDAVDTLLFLSSPKNGGRFPSGSQEGPARSKLPSSGIPSRRVMFENSILKDQPPDDRQSPNSHG